VRSLPHPTTQVWLLIELDLDAIALNEKGYLIPSRYSHFFKSLTPKGMHSDLPYDNMVEYLEIFIGTS
jgi:hypothetical protein